MLKLCNVNSLLLQVSGMGRYICKEGEANHSQSSTSHAPESNAIIDQATHIRNEYLKHASCPIA